AEDILIQKNQLAGQHLEHERIRLEPIFAAVLIIFHQQQLADFAIQASVQRAEEFQLNEIDPACLVEAMGNLYPALLEVEIAIVADGKDDVVVSRLHLHPVSGG